MNARICPRILIAASLCCCTPLVAQLQGTVTAVGPLAVAASTASGSNTMSTPAGPLPWSFGLFLAGPSFQEHASYSGWSSDGDLLAQLHIAYSARVLAGNGAASSGVNTVRWDLTAPQSTPVSFEIDFRDLTLAGSPQPLVVVDIGDDGVVEFTNGQPAVPGVWTAGPTPLRVRVTTYAAVNGIGQTLAGLTLRALPANGITVTQWNGGCGGFLSLNPTFVDKGLTVFSSIGDLVVLGLDAAPIVFPTINGLPCILLPRADVIVMQTVNYGVHLPLGLLPPLSFWVQSAKVTPTEIRLSPAFRVQS